MRLSILGVMLSVLSIVSLEGHFVKMNAVKSIWDVSQTDNLYVILTLPTFCSGGETLR